MPEICQDLLFVYNNGRGIKASGIITYSENNPIAKVEFERVQDMENFKTEMRKDVFVKLEFDEHEILVRQGLAELDQHAQIDADYLRNSIPVKVDHT